MINILKKRQTFLKSKEYHFIKIKGQLKKKKMYSNKSEKPYLANQKLNLYYYKKIKNKIQDLKVQSLKNQLILFVKNLNLMLYKERIKGR